MIHVNLQNVEELVFYDTKLQLLFPEFKHLFDSWRLSVRYPVLRNLGRRSIADFLNHLNEDRIVVLSKYFMDEVKIDVIDYHIVRNSEHDINNVVENAKRLWHPNIAPYRRGNRLYISSWR
jgi:hypothetical protein